MCELILCRRLPYATKRNNPPPPAPNGCHGAAVKLDIVHKLCVQARLIRDLHSFVLGEFYLAQRTHERMIPGDVNELHFWINNL